MRRSCVLVELENVLSVPGMVRDRAQGRSREFCWQLEKILEKAGEREPSHREVVEEANSLGAG